MNWSFDWLLEAFSSEISIKNGRATQICKFRSMAAIMFNLNNHKEVENSICSGKWRWNSSRRCVNHLETWIWNSWTVSTTITRVTSDFDMQILLCKWGRYPMIESRVAVSKCCDLKPENPSKISKNPSRCQRISQIILN